MRYFRRNQILRLESVLRGTFFKTESAFLYERGILMAGNATNNRQRAERAYREAKSNGVTGRDLKVLLGAYQAAQAIENSECGTHHVVRE